ncbi:MAG: SDR family NAD(P)-dependent oxidoreductase [Flavisolibacter sp.]|nr:SDR family NAD(P)-dependent oxidoreductase [Flavisolibacter sp.]
MKTTENTILITGGTSGIGSGFAKAYLKEGNHVIITGRREDRLEKIKEEFPSIATKRCDISHAAEREELTQWTLQHFPDLNVLINNAGIQLLTDLTKPVEIKRVHAEIDTNFIAPVHLSSLLASHLMTKHEAAIINISSGLAFTPLSFMPIYCASKAAIHSLTLSLRHQLKNTSVKVFEIVPPSVDTELGHDRRADKSKSHGGIPISEFIEGAMDAIRNDVWEAAIGMAHNLWQKREALFERMNP